MILLGRIGKSLTFSNVIACLALFIALGGSVYAANRINGKQIKKNSLPGNRIKPKTIKPNRIKPKSLTARQVRANSLGGDQINEGTLIGVSAAALASIEYQTTTVDLPSGRFTTATANCPAGAYVTGGGATVNNEERAQVIDDAPSPLRTGWTATGYTWYSNPVMRMTVTAICVVVEKPGESAVPGNASVSPPVQYQPG